MVSFPNFEGEKRAVFIRDGKVLTTSARSVEDYSLEGGNVSYSRLFENLNRNRLNQNGTNTLLKLRSNPNNHQAIRQVYSIIGLLNQEIEESRLEVEREERRQEEEVAFQLLSRVWDTPLSNKQLEEKLE